MLLKYAPTASEAEEGVAFYGRAGTALMKALRRLQIDPLAVYGTLCVKCPVSDPSLADPGCVARVVEEIAIVQPKMIVAMGEDALRTLDELQVPLARTLDPTPGEVQQLTPSIDALYVPTSTARSTRRRPSASSGRPSGCSARGTPTCPLLGLAAGAAYFLLVGELPGASSVVAGCAGAAAVALCGLGALPGREDAVALVVLGLGAALLATALTGQDVGAAANPVEALFAASAGLLFAQAFAIPAAVVALPILVGGIDAAAGPSPAPTATRATPIGSTS
jgi:uracil-DNA glycosylase family 4